MRIQATVVETRDQKSTAGESIATTESDRSKSSGETSSDSDLTGKSSASSNGVRTKRAATSASSTSGVSAEVDAISMRPPSSSSVLPTLFVKKQPTLLDKCSPKITFPKEKLGLFKKFFKDCNYTEIEQPNSSESIIYKVHEIPFIRNLLFRFLFEPGKVINALRPTVPSQCKNITDEQILMLARDIEFLRTKCDSSDFESLLTIIDKDIPKVKDAQIQKFIFFKSTLRTSIAPDMLDHVLVKVDEIKQTKTAQEQQLRAIEEKQKLEEERIKAAEDERRKLEEKRNAEEKERQRSEQQAQLEVGRLQHETTKRAKRKSEQQRIKAKLKKELNPRHPTCKPNESKKAIARRIAEQKSHAVKLKSENDIGPGWDSSIHIDKPDISRAVIPGKPCQWFTGFPSLQPVKRKKLKKSFVRTKHIYENTNRNKLPKIGAEQSTHESPQPVNQSRCL